MTRQYLRELPPGWPVHRVDPRFGRHARPAVRLGYHAEVHHDTREARPAERFEQRLIQRRHIPTVCAADDLGRRDDDRAEEQLAIRLFAQKNEPTCQRNVEDRLFFRRIEYVLALAISPWIAEKRERPEQNDVRRPNPPDRGEQLPRTGADAPLVVLAKLPFRQPLIDEHVASGGRTSRGREHGRAECEHRPGRCHEHSAPPRQNADPAEGSNQTE